MLIKNFIINKKGKISYKENNDSSVESLFNSSKCKIEELKLKEEFHNISKDDLKDVLDSIDFFFDKAIKIEDEENEFILHPCALKDYIRYIYVTEYLNKDYKEFYPIVYSNEKYDTFDIILGITDDKTIKGDALLEDILVQTDNGYFNSNGLIFKNQKIHDNLQTALINDIFNKSDETSNLSKHIVDLDNSKVVSFINNKLKELIEGLILKLDLKIKFEDLCFKEEVIEEKPKKKRGRPSKKNTEVKNNEEENFDVKFEKLFNDEIDDDFGSILTDLKLTLNKIENPKLIKFMKFVLKAANIILKQF